MMLDAPDEAVGQLLDRWKRGDRDDEAWYRLLSGPMRRRAWQGIQRMTGQPPNDDDVGEVLYDAFTEFLDLDPAHITSPLGLASTIAFRRGQDLGRALNQQREFPDSDEVPARRDPPPGPEEQLLEAEAAAEREHTLTLARECGQELPPGQAEVLKTTIFGQQNLSDWANDQGKSYQAADQQRKRALKALRECVKRKKEERR